jgi:hypothetical protein
MLQVGGSQVLDREENPPRVPLDVLWASAEFVAT